MGRGGGNARPYDRTPHRLRGSPLPGLQFPGASTATPPFPTHSLQMKNSFPTALLVLLLLCGGPLLPWGGSLLAQTPPEIEAAQALQEAGEYAAAADALRPYLQRFPGDSGTRWLFGRLLHWAGAHREARTAYETVLTGTPNDPWLNLEYAEVLVALGELGRARSVLSAVTDWGPSQAAAEAARGLRDIGFLTRPWTSLGLGVLDDNQPYRRYEGKLEAGFFLHPLWTLSAGGNPRVLDPGDNRTAGNAWGQLSGSIPALGLSLSARVGGSFQGGGTPQGKLVLQSSGSAFIGKGEIGLKLPGDLTLTAAAERSRYLWTAASVDSLVMVNTIEAKLGRADAPGWAGEAVVQRGTYDDNNHVSTAYAWVLAPVVPSRLRLGYSISRAEADETRWVEVRHGGSLDLGATIPGRYAPYFTPNQEMVHSALAELSAQAGVLSLKLHGTVGFHATEQAPVIIVTGLEPDPPPLATAEIGTLFFYERSFTPWRGTLNATLPVSDALTLTGTLEAWETAYYEVKQFGLGMTYRLPPSP